jgi:uncharacterized membrane protein
MSRCETSLFFFTKSLNSLHGSFTLLYYNIPSNETSRGQSTYCEILQTRHARGELTREEYQRTLQDLA